VSKIKRDVNAFAQRVKMSRHTNLFLLVEGRVNDRPFYERLLKPYARERGISFSVRIVEDLSLDGASSGGKPFALVLFKHLLKQNLLTQANSEGKRFIGFAVDKDYDEYAINGTTHDHIILTESPDVESEIIRHSSLIRSVGSTYGLTRNQTQRAIKSKEQMFLDIAEAWLPWFSLRATALAAGARDAARYGGLSVIHEKDFGPHLPATEASLRQSILDWAERNDRLAEVRLAEESVRSRIETGRGFELVKGRWLTKYVRHLVEKRLAAETVSLDFPPDMLVNVCLETIKFNRGWTMHYRRQFDLLMDISPEVR